MSDFLQDVGMAVAKSNSARMEGMEQGALAAKGGQYR